MLRKMLLVMSLLLCCQAYSFAAVSEPATKEPFDLPPGTFTAKEVMELFIGNTVESVTAVRKRVSISYYDPRGEVRQLRKGKKRFGYWRINANGRICLKMEDYPEKCRIIVKEKGLIKKYIVKKNGRHQHSVTYRSFRKGNPLGL